MLPVANKSEDSRMSAFEWLEPELYFLRKGHEGDLDRRIWIGMQMRVYNS